MGCSASRSSTAVVPMPTELKARLNSPQEANKTLQSQTEDVNANAKNPSLEKKRSTAEDSLHGSQCSLNSTSDSAKSDRESSATSTRTSDSGLGEFEEDSNIISDRSTWEKQKTVLAEERPPTPGLFVFNS